MLKCMHFIIVMLMVMGIVELAFYLDGTPLLQPSTNKGLMIVIILTIQNTFDLIEQKHD